METLLNLFKTRRHVFTSKDVEILRKTHPMKTKSNKEIKLWVQAIKIYNDHFQTNYCLLCCRPDTLNRIIDQVERIVKNP